MSEGGTQGAVTLARPVGGLGMEVTLTLRECWRAAGGRSGCEF